MNENEQTDSADSAQDACQPESSDVEAVKPKPKRKIKKRIKDFCKRVKQDTLTLYLCFFEIPWYRKLLPALVLVYAFSPLDFIPDFIPVIGLLDDLLLIPLGVWLCRKVVPKNIWDDCSRKVADGVKIKMRYKVMGCILIVLLWAGIVSAVVFGILYL